MIDFMRDTCDEIVAAGEEGAPQEVCGILAGEYGEQRSAVAETYPTENAADTPETRYAIDPEEQLSVIEKIEAAGSDVVGFYHSHPAGPPQPSQTDIARATWPGYSYVICALDGPPDVGSWRWQGEEAGFERETVRVTDR